MQNGAAVHSRSLKLCLRNSLPLVQISSNQFHRTEEHCDDELLWWLDEESEDAAPLEIMPPPQSRIRPPVPPAANSPPTSRQPEDKVTMGLNDAEPAEATELPPLNTRGAFEERPMDASNPPPDAEPRLEAAGDELAPLDEPSLTTWTIRGCWFSALTPKKSAQCSICGSTLNRPEDSIFCWRMSPGCNIL